MGCLSSESVAYSSSLGVSVEGSFVYSCFFDFWSLLGVDSFGTEFVGSVLFSSFGVYSLLAVGSFLYSSLSDFCSLLRIDCLRCKFVGSGLSPFLEIDPSVWSSFLDFCADCRLTNFGYTGFKSVVITLGPVGVGKLNFGSV